MSAAPIKSRQEPRPPAPARVLHCREARSARSWTWTKEPRVARALQVIERIPDIEGVPKAHCEEDVSVSRLAPGPLECPVAFLGAQMRKGCCRLCLSPKLGLRCAPRPKLFELLLESLTQGSPDVRQGRLLGRGERALEVHRSGLPDTFTGLPVLAFRSHLRDGAEPLAPLAEHVE